MTASAVEHLMHSAILTVSGRDTGATLFGPADSAPSRALARPRSPRPPACTYPPTLTIGRAAAAQCNCRPTPKSRVRPIAIRTPAARPPRSPAPNDAAVRSHRGPLRAQPARVFELARPHTHTDSLTQVAGWLSHGLTMRTDRPLARRRGTSRRSSPSAPQPPSPVCLPFGKTRIAAPHTGRRTSL